MVNNAHPHMIGVLYPGEMGASFAKLLGDAGYRVVTTLEGRSTRTHRLCCEAGLSVVDSLAELLRDSAVVISLVSPGAALSLAKEVATLLGGLERPGRRLLYMDANSISPMTVAQISEVLRRVHVDFVDASIFGLASQLRQRGTLYLSGSRADEISHEFEPFLHVKVVGDRPGQASAFKMIVSGIPKGLSGLFIETMLFAQDMDLLDEALEACDEIYPSMMEVVRRMVPTYPQHAARRSQELQAVEETMLISGSTPRIVRAVREVTSALANIDWPADHDPQQWTIPEVIREIHKEGILRASESHSSQSPEQSCEDGGQPISIGYRSTF